MQIIQLLFSGPGFIGQLLLAVGFKAAIGYEIVKSKSTIVSALGEHIKVVLSTVFPYYAEFVY